MLPAFKEVVEELFRRKLVKVVFATETLALGINMPARTVVLEKLEKFNGEARVPITSGEYTQLTGRAGRRGIDVEGHAVIQWSETLDPQAVASLASRQTFPLRSSFRPTYNMAVNLIDQFGRDRTREILESSFAQFQADRAVVTLARQVQKQKESLVGYLEAMQCHLGDFADYAELRNGVGELEKQGSRVVHFSAVEREQRKQELAELRRRLKAHPVYGCPDREKHARWAERWLRLRKQTDVKTREIQSRTGAVAAIFDRVSDVLIERKYLRRSQSDSLALTPTGRTLKRIYGERDLLLAESLHLQIWDSLDAPSCAALACALVYEPRRDDEFAEAGQVPHGPFRAALGRMHELWALLESVERAHQLPSSDPLGTGLCLAMYSWARGASLDSVLMMGDLAAGDFVRWTKQTIDLLDHVSLVADGTVSRRTRSAIDDIRRGVVAYSSVA